MKAHWLASIGAAGTVSLVAWGLHARLAPPRADDSSRTVLYYQDPMHPSYTSATPGKAPDCGMDLVAVYAAPVPAPPAGSAIVRVDRRQLGLLGLRVEQVARSRVTDTYRTVGRVVADENRVFAVTAGGDGWVTRTFPGTATGDPVRMGQPLIAVYGREYTTAQRTFLFALRARDSPPPVSGEDDRNEAALALEEARLFLRHTGVGNGQIAEIASTRRVLPEITLTSPATGVIVSRGVAAGGRFERGLELFRIADLRRVSILADLSAGDDRYFPSGAAVAVSIPGQPGAGLTARVAGAPPRFEAGSRTLTVRLDADNRQLTLRSDQLVDLEFPLILPEATTVPESALTETAGVPSVFVVRGEGVFEPRIVTTGWRRAGRVAILSGLEPRETVVVAGTFLLSAAAHVDHDGGRR